MPTEPTPREKTPREKLGWNLMLLGFFIVLLAGVAYFVAPRSENPVYNMLGNYLMAAGLIVYIAGRVQRWRGRKDREK